jgi:ABC-type sulfate transport system permease component
MIDVNRRVLPGFSLSLGYTLAYLGLLIAVPLAAGFFKASQLSFEAFWAAVSSERAVAAYGLTVGASFVSAAINAALGLLVAWVLVRYEFPLKRLLDSLVDLPFALPTAVAGLVYSDLLVAKGWYGRFLASSRSASRARTRGSESCWCSSSSASPSSCGRWSPCCRGSTPTSRRRPRASAPAACRRSGESSSPPSFPRW